MIFEALQGKVPAKQSSHSNRVVSTYPDNVHAKNQEPVRVCNLGKILAFQC